MIEATKRECGSCTVCCGGILASTIHGHPMHPGRPCFYLDKQNHKCSIYNDRPVNPCQTYECAWLSNYADSIPEWMKPNLSGVLITPKRWTNGIYWVVNEVDGKPYDPNILYWIISFTEEKSIPMILHIGLVTHHRGSREFQEFLKQANKIFERA